MDYLNIEEVANQWGLSVRTVQLLCKEGKIEGATRLGRAWMIPKHAKRPADGRSRAAKALAQEEDRKDLRLPRRTPFLYMSDLYSVPGTADTVREQLAYHHEAQMLFEAEIAYSQGQIDRVYERATYLLNQHSGFYAVIGGGMLLALCAIWKGDLAMWRKAKIHISEAPSKNDVDREIISLSLTAVDSMLYHVSGFPEWFKIGCFEPLHKDAMPAAKVFYAKYLYAAGYAVATKEYKLEGVQGLSLMTMIPNTIEPLISWAHANGTVISEIYLRMTCAVVYHNSGRDDQAIRHIDRAIALALPDSLYGLLAEYGRTLDSLLADRLNAVNPEAYREVYRLYKIYNEGWSKLSGAVRGKQIITTLSPKEREVAKLAAFGMSNPEIAKKLHMSVSVVKQAIRITMEKSGMSRDEFAAIL
ncbi:MAG: helix-turn-helix domain-containing protein, partial [Clostridia bacterium]|nr:helix-turn-helix domain-containing protein [Clostridia bacterium]